MKLIILDRDGVINEDSDAYIQSPKAWQLIPGSGEAIAALNHAGFIVVVATNQSGIARGYYDWPTLTAIHDKMAETLAKFGAKVDKIYVCPHHPDEGCDCRKPKVGLLQQIEADYPSVNWQAVYFIGDTRGDIEAGWLMGCRPLLVCSGKGKRTLVNYPELEEQVKIFVNLQQAVTYILNEQGEET